MYSVFLKGSSFYSKVVITGEALGFVGNYDVVSKTFTKSGKGLLCAKMTCPFLDRSFFMWKFKKISLLGGGIGCFNLI